MTLILHARIFAILAVAVCPPFASAWAQTSSDLPTSPPGVFRNPQVEIEYVRPRSPQYQEIYGRLTNLKVLEMFQDFLAPLRLTKKLVLRADECGALEKAYVPSQPATICYEYVRQIEQHAPMSATVRIGPANLSKDSIIIGAFINVMLTRIATSIFDILEVPIWGREDDASDFVAAFIMLEFQPKPGVVWATLAGTSWFLAQRSFAGRGDFAETLRGWEAQRFYNYACMAYGARPELFKFLVASGTLPGGRANHCRQDYAKLHRAFKAAIMPHVDMALLQKVREINWSQRLRMPN